MNPEGYWLLPIAGIGTIEFRTGAAQTIIAPTENAHPGGMTMKLLHRLLLSAQPRPANSSKNTEHPNFWMYQ